MKCKDTIIFEILLKPPMEKNLKKYGISQPTTLVRRQMVSFMMFYFGGKGTKNIRYRQNDSNDFGGKCDFLLW